MIEHDVLDAGLGDADDDDFDLSEVFDSQLPDNRYLDRELSWLAFNQRVLELAEDSALPVLERANFLAIFASNLDEFFMVRVAGLKRRIITGLAVPTNVGRSPAGGARRHLRRCARPPTASRGRVDVAGAPGARGCRHRGHLVGPARGRRAHPRVGVLPGPGLPGADAARRRPRAPLPVHLGAVAEPRDPHPQREDRAAGVRAAQGPADAPALRGCLPPRRHRALPAARGAHREPPRRPVPRHGDPRPPRVPPHAQRGRRDRGGRDREPHPGTRGRAPAAPVRPADPSRGRR